MKYLFKWSISQLIPDDLKESWDLLKTVINWTPVILYVGALMMMFITGMSALAFYYFLTHLDFFIFDIPIMILEAL